MSHLDRAGRPRHFPGVSGACARTCPGSARRLRTRADVTRFRRRLSGCRVGVSARLRCCLTSPEQETALSASPHLYGRDVIISP